jgi:hypothetical protein
MGELRYNRFTNNRQILLGVLVFGLILQVIAASTTEAATRIVSKAKNAKDVGSCTQLPCATIKYAISKAVSGDTISVFPGTYTEANIAITTNLTIRGAGASKTIVQGAAIPGKATDRVFSVCANKKGVVKVNFEKMTIRHGKSKYGGGICIGSTNEATIDECVITNNSVTSDGLGINAGLGGGIFMNNDSSLILKNSTISKNTATSQGGGILSWCFTTLKVSNSTITENSANHGGGIDIGAPSTLIIDNSTISKNLAKFSGGGINNADKATISNSKFSDNGANNRGGGIRNDGTMTIINSTISANGSPGEGGGIVNFGTLAIDRSTISNNGAYHGGGIQHNGKSLVISNSTISTNTANWGGGINNDGILTISNSTLSGNSNIGILNSGNVNIKSSIVANTGFYVTAPKDCSNYDSKSIIKASGVNLNTDMSCAGFTHIKSAQLNLGPLKLNLPGTTDTHALPKNSAAVNAATDCKDFNGNIVLTDQRGIKRPQPSQGKCDVGAYELNGLITTSGDINFDGKINVIDARIGQLAADGSIELVGEYYKAADWDKNGYLDTADATAIAMTSIGLKKAGPFTLTVKKAGSGRGQVTSTPTGINCGNNCSYSFKSAVVVLIATPDRLSSHTKWEGCDSVTDEECIVWMNSDREAKATFNLRVER